MGCITIPIILSVFALGGGIAWFVIRETAPPRDAAHAFLKKARAQDWEGAYELAGPTLRAQIPEQMFEEAMHAKIPDAIESNDATFNSTSISNNIACLSGTTSPGDSPIHVRVVQVRGQWQVDDIGQYGVMGCYGNAD